MDLPQDWNEFFRLLSLNRVRFLVVGAHALAANGRPRATADLDIFVEPTRANAEALVTALEGSRRRGAPRRTRTARPTAVARLPPRQQNEASEAEGRRAETNAVSITRALCVGRRQPARRRTPVAQGFACAGTAALDDGATAQLLSRLCLQMTSSSRGASLGEYLNLSFTTQVGEEVSPAASSRA